MWRIKAELFLKTVMGYAVILVALFSVSWLCDKIINTVIILMSYGGTRWVFPLTYHAKTDKGCLMFTIACFSIAIIIALPINLSIVASVIVGMAISTFLFFLQYFLDLKASREIADKDALIEKCKALGYNELKTQMAIKFFIDNDKPREVWLWLMDTKQSNIEWDSVKKIKYRMRKELFDN
jgi:accessory gene regulator protein AgrB